MSEQRSTADLRPVDPKTGARIGPLAQPGYYPGYSTLAQQKFWDAATRRVVLARVHEVPPLRWFTPQEARFWQVVCDRVLPQDDRDAEHRIPIVPAIDERLYLNKHDGYRYEDMPPDREAFRFGREGIERIARAKHARGFVELAVEEQEEILRELHDGKPSAGNEIWARMPAHRFWMLLVQDCAEAYYAHPYAWDEIGYGGPAYPRGYMRLERGEPEPWEVEEQRYEWAAPPAARSESYEPVGGDWEQLGVPGQGGTH